MIGRGGCLGSLLLAAAVAAGGGAGIPAALRGLLETPATQSAKVVRVVDGDTLLVSRGVRRERVRLLGVDAPEGTRHGRAECGARAASEAARRWVARARGRVQLSRDRLAHERDPHGRLLAHVSSARGGDLAGWLLRRGLARTVSYERRPLAAHPRLLALEASARGRRAGLWSKCPGWAREHAIPFAARPPFGLARGTAQRPPVDPPMVVLLDPQGSDR